MQFINNYDSVLKYIPVYLNNDLYFVFECEYPIKATMSVNNGPKNISLDGICLDLVKGDIPDRVYAITENRKLYYINPQTGTVDQTFTLPFIPRQMAYSVIDHKLYISSGYSYGINGCQILIWDVIANTNNTINLPGVSTIDGVEAAPGLRKLIVLASDQSRIINMDTMAISNISLTPSGYIGIDESQNKLYVGTNSTNYLLSCYAINNTENTVTLLRQINTGGFSPKNIALSKDCSKILISKDMVDGSRDLIVYNTLDFSIAGKWTFTNYLNLGYAIFSPDGTKVYLGFASYTEDLIYELNAQNYSVIRKLPFPEGGGATHRFILNSDGSVLVACRTNGYDSEAFFYANTLSGTEFINKSINVTNSPRLTISQLPSKKLIKYNGNNK